MREAFLVPIAGRKPKGDGRTRHRVQPVQGWTEVADVPFEDAPVSLPEKPRGEVEVEAPEPPRPLAQQGRTLWERTWRAAGGAPVDEEALLVLCEQMDERVSLRVQVLRQKEWRSRAALRALDAQVAQGLAALGLQSARSIPERWPAETRRWWRAVSSMPHCALWSSGDWQFALDTALIAATFHAGSASAAAELRQRERVMGTTTDARRDLRIRYVPPEPEEETPSGVAVMDQYRRMASGA